MNEPDEKEIARMLKSIEREAVNYPCYLRGVICGVIGAAIGFLPVYLLLGAINGARISPWPWALVAGGVLGVIAWGFGTFRPPTT